VEKELLLKRNLKRVSIRFKEGNSW